jgi:adenine-specific DNA-methyltransferase
MSIKSALRITEHYTPDSDVVLYPGDCRDLLKEIPPRSVQLFVTSPPYNIGKEYEKKTTLEEYKSFQSEVIRLCVERLHPSGSICWEVGNHVEGQEVFPLDIELYPIFKSLGLKLRNRIVWHFGHGLHCSRRFSGRHEAILWFTKSNDFRFDLDSVRVPSKYPGKKYYKGPKRGQFSGNPLGKNPGDVWDIPNVKHNHPEKTEHPCQFPVELVQRLIRSLTAPGDLVVDPFMGVGSTAVAAVLEARKVAGAEIVARYRLIARERIEQAANGTARIRPIGRPIYTPTPNLSVVRRPELVRAAPRPVEAYDGSAVAR